MSNENSNLRVGSAGAGLFVGSTEITGGGLYYEDLIRIGSDIANTAAYNIQFFAVVNLSSADITIGSSNIGASSRIHIQPKTIVRYEQEEFYDLPIEGNTLKFATSQTTVSIIANCNIVNNGTEERQSCYLETYRSTWFDVQLQDYNNRFGVVIVMDTKS